MTERHRLPRLLRPEAPAWLPSLNPFSWTTRAVMSFSPTRMPPMTRVNYRREVVAAMFLPWIIAVVEGGVAGVIVNKYFSGEVSRGLLDAAVAVVTAAPAFANILSFLFVRLTHGKHKVRSITVLQIAVVLMAVGMAAAPKSDVGLVLLATCASLARCFLAGVVTLRASVWRQNYPREARARLTGRISAIQTLTIALAGFVIGWAMDVDEDAFRWLIPMIAVASLAGVGLWSRVRVRRHRQLLTTEQADDPSDGPSFNPLGVLRVLKRDKLFAWYMGSQFLLGFANMMCFSTLVILVEERFELGYTKSMLINHGIRLALITLTVSMWAKLLDGMHVAKYRSIHTWTFAVMTMLFFVGGVAQIEWLLYAAATVHGLAFAGGSLAWNIGHNDFADDANASQYMTAHVTLTGLRGLIAPFAGIYIYRWFEGAFGEHAGSYTFALASGLIMVSAVMFFGLARVIDRRDAESAA
ncbi:MAG: MFS transporter [Planctomycetota bacterium]